MNNVLFRVDVAKVAQNWGVQSTALDLNLARLKCLALLIAATMKHRSVNLVQLTRSTRDEGTYLADWWRRGARVASIS